MAKMEQITTKTKIAGYEKEVAQLEQLKDFLHNAEKYANCGYIFPKGYCFTDISVWVKR